MNFQAVTDDWEEEHLEPGQARPGNPNGRPTHLRSWWQSRLARSSQLRPGPINCRELFQWPRRLCQNLFSSGDGLNDARMRLNFDRWVDQCGGFNLYGDFSGFESAVDAMSDGVAGISETRRFSRNPLHYRRSSDMGALQQKILCGRAAQHDACVFRNFYERLPPIATSWIKQAQELEQDFEDDKAATLQAKIKANREIDQFLEQHEDLLFPIDAKSLCLQHNRHCSVIPSRMRTHSFQQYGSCKRKRDDLDEPIHEDMTGQRCAPLNMNVAGVPCLPYSSASSHTGVGHISHPADTAWQLERRLAARRKMEDMVHLECVPGYPIKDLRQRLHGHTVVHVITGPEYLGWPAKRRRLNATAVNNATLVWTGPATQADVQKDFERRFYYANSVDGECLFCETEEAVLDEYVKLAARQRNMTTPAELKQMSAPLELTTQNTIIHAERLIRARQAGIGLAWVAWANLEIRPMSRTMLSMVC